MKLLSDVLWRIAFIVLMFAVAIAIGNYVTSHPPGVLVWILAVSGAVLSLIALIIDWCGVWFRKKRKE